MPAGADALEGGDGIDLLSFLGSDAALRADLSAGTVAGGHAEGDIFPASKAWAAAHSATF